MIHVHFVVFNAKLMPHGEEILKKSQKYKIITCALTCAYPPDAPYVLHT